MGNRKQILFCEKHQCYKKEQPVLTKGKNYINYRCLKCHCESSKKRCIEKPEVVKESARKTYLKRRDKRIEYSKKWYRERKNKLLEQGLWIVKERKRTPDFCEKHQIEKVLAYKNGYKICRPCVNEKVRERYLKKHGYLKRGVKICHIHQEEKFLYINSKSGKKQLKCKSCYKEMCRNWRDKNPTDFKEYYSKLKSNPERYKKSAEFKRNANALSIKNLDDNYIKYRLKYQKEGYKGKNPPEELIALKRTILILKREIKNANSKHERT